MNDSALAEARLQLLERVARTTDEHGADHPTNLAHEAGTHAEQDAVMAALEDLEHAGLLRRRGSERAPTDDRWSISSAGRAALDHRAQLRTDPRSTALACRLAVATWLYAVKHRGEPDGDWSRFTADTGNLWVGEPFPDAAIDNASGWLHDQELIDGLTAWQATRIVRPSLTAAGERWLEEQQPPNAPPAAPTTNYYGPVTNVHGASAQVAVGNNSVVQEQRPDAHRATAAELALAKHSPRSVSTSRPIAGRRPDGLAVWVPQEPGDTVVLEVTVDAGVEDPWLVWQRGPGQPSEERLSRTGPTHVTLHGVHVAAPVNRWPTIDRPVDLTFKGVDAVTGLELQWQTTLGEHWPEGTIYRNELAGQLEPTGKRLARAGSS